MAKIIKKIKNKTKDTCIQDKISRSRVKWFFAIILILLPIAYCFIFIYQYGINIPYNDEFLFFPFLEKVKNHNVTFLDFFEDINSHRIVIPKIIAIINMVLFDYNSKINMLLFFAFLCFTYALICAYLCNLKCFSRGGGGGFAILLFCAVMLFTTKQSENLFWGFQFPWAIITFLSVLSFILFEKAISLGKWKYLVVSIICAYAASFSSAHGLYISTTCIIIYILLMLTRQKINRNFFCAYIVSTIALFCIYFLIEPVYFPQQMLDKKIIDLIKFYIVAMGSSFNHSLFSGIIIIGLCVYACVYCIIKKNILENILPLSLIIFSNIFIASITMGRAMQGLRIATSSRYVTVTLLCCIGIALIAFINIKNRKLLTIMLIIFMLANICAQFEKLGNRDWITVPISYGIWWKTLQENSYKICKNYEQVANQNITYLKIANYEAPEITYAYLRIMDKNKWSIFAND